MSNPLLGRHSTSVPPVNVYARAKLSFFMLVPCSAFPSIFHVDRWMALQHKQKVHGISFAAVPQAVPPQVQVQVQPPRPSSSAACYCHICNRSYTSTSALEQHYRDTPVHSKCSRCNIGFVDDDALRAVSSLISNSYLDRIIIISIWTKARRLRPSSKRSNCLARLLLPYLR